jgi:hypothetical protein
VITDASIIFVNFLIFVLYLASHLTVYWNSTANVSLPILRPLYRFLQQLATALGCPYWGAQWGVSVHAGDTAAGAPAGHCRSRPVPMTSGASNSAKAHLNAVETTRRKRRRRDDDEESPPSQNTKPDSGQPSSQFACPFYLHNRHQWRNCLRNYTLNRVVDVRLHLLRVHLLSPQCPSCGREFKGDSAEDRCNAHIQLRCCQPLPLPLPARHGVTGDQLEAMRAIATRRTGRRVLDPAAAKWFDMWDIIFPGTAHPASPYITEHPDVQLTIDMNDLVFSGEEWRNVIAPTRESSPSLRNMSRSTLAAVAQGFEAVYRRLLHRNQDRPTSPEVASNTAAADRLTTPVGNSMDTFHHSHGWEILPSASQTAQASRDPVPLSTERPAIGAAGTDPWAFQPAHEQHSSVGLSHNTLVAQESQSCPPFSPESHFFTDAQIQASDLDFPIPDEFLASGTSARPGSPSQFFTNYGSNPSGFWGHPDTDAADTA